jgi:hypothetical protein
MTKTALKRLNGDFRLINFARLDLDGSRSQEFNG